MWLIPQFLLKKKYGLLIFLNLLLLAVYIYVRYLNNILVTPDYYQYYKTGSVLHRQTTIEIISSEFFRGLQFVFLSYSYRFIFDWVIIERIKRNLENEKLKADLALLRYQLNPHFLFNTINDIYYLAIIKSDKTAEALLKLSDLLRYVLHEKEDWVPIEKEINHLKKFVELHYFRFPDDVVKMNIEEGIGLLLFNIPPLLLTTFVENAFKHGQPGTVEKPVLIDIIIQDNSLLYEVENPVGNLTSKDETSGIGIPNLEKRLNLLYPGKHEISFEETGERFIAKLKLQLS
jgi:LytS/YehU family sensor histidine kinase